MLTNRDQNNGRQFPRLMFIICIILLIVKVALAFTDAKFSEKQNDAANKKENNSQLRWYPISEAEAISQLTGKPVLYYFTAEWCTPCKVLQKEVFADQTIANKIGEQFIPVMVKVAQEEGANSIQVRALTKKYQIMGFPTLVIPSLQGCQIEIKQGYEGRLNTTDFIFNSLAKAKAKG